ncbi:MAG TPA: N-acyl-D-glutamate deacylase, partial [Candidatus Limnocylindria bacterium]
MTSRDLPEHVDLLISGGSLVDGSGSPARPGTVGVRDGRLHIGPVDWRPRAARTIDASGMVVTPGF